MREYGPRRKFPSKNVTRFRYTKNGSGGYTAEKHSVHLVRSTNTRPTYYWVNPAAKHGGGGGGAKLAALNKAIWTNLNAGNAVSPADLARFGFRGGKSKAQKWEEAKENFAKMAAARDQYYNAHGGRKNYKFGPGQVNTLTYSETRKSLTLTPHLFPSSAAVAGHPRMQGTYQ